MTSAATSSGTASSATAPTNRRERQVVRGDQDRRAAVGQLADDLAEDGVPRHHVEAQRGVVEDEQLGPMAQRDREHRRSLLPLRQAMERRVEGDGEPAEAFLRALGIPALVEARHQRDEPCR